MITCESYHATIPESTCIARHKLINQKHHKGNGKNWGNSGEKVLRNEACVNCEIGLKLYEQSLKGEKPMVQGPTRKCSECKQEYPLTDEFFDKAGRGLSRACKTCRANEEQAEPTPEKETGAQILDAMPDDLPEYKFCAYDDCGKIFYPEEDDKTWANLRYCSLDCRYAGKRARERERERLIRKRKKVEAEALVVDPAQAREVAQEVVEGWEDILDATIRDEDRHLIQSLLIKVGVECQERAAFRGAA